MPGSPPTTPNIGLPRYADSDTADFASDINPIVDLLDEFWSSGALGVRPAASTRGRLYFATDVNQLFWDTGSAWYQVPSLAAVPVLTATAFIGPGAAAGTYFFTQDGSIAAAGASTTKALKFWHVDPVTYLPSAETPEFFLKTTIGTAVSPGTTVTSNLAQVSLAGGSGGMTPTVVNVGGPFGSAFTPGTDALVEAVASAFSLPSGAAYYCPVVTLAAASAANSATVVTVQLFLQNP